MRRTRLPGPKLPLSLPSPPVATPRGSDQRASFTPRPAVQRRRTVHTATFADIGDIDRLRMRDSNALGFLSHRALVEKLDRGQIRVVRDASGGVAAFLLHGALGRPEVRLFQIAVAESSRGAGLARLLLRDLIRRAARRGTLGISLRCRDRLPANHFWRRAGFELIALEPAATGALFVWGYRLMAPTPNVAAPAFTFHTRWRRCASCGRWTCGSWSAGAIRRGVCSLCAADFTCESVRVAHERE